MENIIKLFEKTFNDKIFTRPEQQEIRNYLNNKKFSLNELDFLRSRIFGLATESFKEYSQQAVLNWLEEAVKLVMKADDVESNSEAAYFSPGSDCLDAILDLLKSTQKKLEICVFTISDNRISKEIINCVDRGISVRIITDNDKTNDQGSDIANIANHGVRVKIDRTEKHMHHKFAIFDDSTLITGSYNWTRSATEYNQENIIVSKNELFLKKFNTEFERLWDTLADY